MTVYECTVTRAADSAQVLITNETFFLIPQGKQIVLYRKMNGELKRLEEPDYRLNVCHNGSIEYKLLGPEESEAIIEKAKKTDHKFWVEEVSKAW